MRYNAHKGIFVHDTILLYGIVLLAVTREQFYSILLQHLVIIYKHFITVNTKLYCTSLKAWHLMHASVMLKLINDQ